MFCHFRVSRDHRWLVLNNRTTRSSGEVWGPDVASFCVEHVFCMISTIPETVIAAAYMCAITFTLQIQGDTDHAEIITVMAALMRSSSRSVHGEAHGRSDRDHANAAEHDHVSISKQSCCMQPQIHRSVAQALRTKEFMWRLAQTLLWLLASSQRHVNTVGLLCAKAVTHTLTRPSRQSWVCPRPLETSFQA